MAENEESDGENPFSFKSFVQSKDKKKKKPGKVRLEGDEEDIFDIFEAPAPSKREKPKLLIDSVDDAAADQPTLRAKEEENPFSFKKFLKTGKPGETLRESDSSPELPDIGLGDIGRVHSSDKTARTGAHLIPQIDDDDDDDDDDDSEEALPFVKPSSRISPEDSLPNSLPDFLSGSAVSTKRVSKSSKEDNGADSPLLDLQPLGVSDLLPRVPLPTPPGQLSDEDDLLIQENTKLKSQLSDSGSEILALRKRVGELQELLKKQRRKEVEETAEMERAVQQVEANLVMATRRAVKAENQAEKLKQEVKTLQAQNASLQRQLLQSADSFLLEVRERASYVSQELAAAATTADVNLRQLLSGVDKLKLLSQVLATVDKITTEPNSKS